MASAENQQHTFPAVPPSFSAGGHEMRDYYAGQSVPRPSSNQAPYLTPYLGLRARLSQIWINRWTILLGLILVRVLIATQSLDQNLDSARKQALSACSSVENAGSTMASMPHYMSQGVNELTAKGVEKAVNGLYSMVDLTITGIEELVVFVIGMLTNTYLCLITFAVAGSLHAALDLVEAVTGFLNQTLPEIGTKVNGAIDDFDDAMNKFLSAFNNIGTLFGGKAKPELNVSLEIDALDHLQIPSNFTDKLNKLNSSIPDFADVKNATETVIRFPFEEVKELVNKAMGVFEFNRSMFPTPQKEQLTFCSDSNGISDFFDDLYKIAHKTKTVFIIVLILGMIAACVPMAYREIRRWRIEQERAALVQQKAFDSMDVVYIASRPYTSSFGIWLSNKFSSAKKQTLVRWAIAYATSMPALFVLSLGIAGLLACLFQFILLKAIEKEVPALTNQVGDFADKVVFALNNASQQWAIGTNKAIQSTNDDINSELFGWVNTTTLAINNTLNKFVDEMSQTLDTVFGGTPLEDPIKEVLNCLIGLKIAGVQKALTWVHDNAHVNFPLLDNDTFSLGAAKSIASNDSTPGDSFLADPSASAKDDISDAVVSLVKKLNNGIQTEAIISLCVALIWVVIALIGFSRSGFMMLKSSKGRAEGGQTFGSDPVTDNNRGHEFVDVPLTTAPPQYEYHKSDVRQDAPYALNPHPFPTYASSSHAEPQQPSNEKVGSVGVRSVVESFLRPSHNRQSSHGAVSAITPIDEKRNPFA